MSEMAVRAFSDRLTQPLRDVLRNREMTPSELIEALAGQLSDADVRVAIWYLISQRELELSADQKLRLVHGTA